MIEYFPAKTGEYPRIFPNFENCAHCEKDFKGNKDNSLHLGRKYAWIFVLRHYLFLVAHSFPRACSRKTAHFSEQIMSLDKYPSIFSRQMATIVYIAPETKFLLILFTIWTNCLTQKIWRNSILGRKSSGRFLHGQPLNNMNYQSEEWKLQKLGWNTSNSSVTTYLRRKKVSKAALLFFSKLYFEEIGRTF